MLRAKGASHEVVVDNFGVRSDRSRLGTCTVWAILIGHSKHHSDILRMLKEKVNTFGVNSNPVDNNDGPSLYPLVQAPEGSTINKYQTQLATKSPPPVGSISERNSQMVFIAHAVVWRGGCCVYGGFVRDLLIRSEVANDIDVGYNPSKISLQNVLVIVREAARAVNLVVVQENSSKGMAYALTLRGGDQRPFDVDVVNMDEVAHKSESPGVDCDVGNMLVEISGKDSFGMRLKVMNRSCLLSLAESQRHCMSKCFVFYYSMETNTARQRLDKYFRRGWVCLTQLSPNFLSWANTAGYSSLLKPREKYSIPFSTLP